VFDKCREIFLKRVITPVVAVAAAEVVVVVGNDVVVALVVVVVVDPVIISDISHNRNLEDYEVPRSRCVRN